MVFNGSEMQVQVTINFTLYSTSSSNSIRFTSCALLYYCILCIPQKCMYIFNLILNWNRVCLILHGIAQWITWIEIVDVNTIWNDCCWLRLGHLTSLLSLFSLSSSFMWRSLFIRDVKLHADTMSLILQFMKFRRQAAFNPIRYNWHLSRKQAYKFYQWIQL